MKKNIYLVEDDADIRAVVEYLLTNLGFRVTGCASVLAFRQKMEDALPDLVLLDMMLPDGDGLQICEALKVDPVTQHIPVVLMSANINNMTIARESAANDFISKPFDIADFTSRVRKQIA